MQGVPIALAGIGFAIIWYPTKEFHFLKGTLRLATRGRETIVGQIQRAGREQHDAGPMSALPDDRCAAGPRRHPLGLSVRLVV
jgi:hypothetical protein